MLYDERDRASVRNAVLAVTTGAWMVWLWTSRATDGHVHVSAATHVVPTVASGMANWLLMLTAMMAPVLIQPIQFIRGQGLARRRTRGTLLFLVSYALIWTVAGAALLAIAATLRSSAIAPVILVGAFLIFAIVWQCSPAKQACLNHCHVRPPLAAFGRRADTGILTFGTTHAAWCIGSCAAWMLVPMLLPGGHFAAMMAATTLIFCERLDRPATPAWQWRGFATAWRLVTAHASLQRYSARNALTGSSCNAR